MVWWLGKLNSNTSLFLFCSATKIQFIRHHAHPLQLEPRWNGEPIAASVHSNWNPLKWGPHFRVRLVQLEPRANGVPIVARANSNWNPVPMGYPSPCAPTSIGTPCQWVYNTHTHQPHRNINQHQHQHEQIRRPASNPSTAQQQMLPPPSNKSKDPPPSHK